nr:MAG TPA: hypothetical protein [Caudoviricetes sp.]
MRLIDADTAAAFAENCGATFVAKRLRDSNAFPEVVTRCKDCKYCGFCGEATNLEVMGFYGFCSRGKRKDGNNVDDHD